MQIVPGRFACMVKPQQIQDATSSDRLAFRWAFGRAKAGTDTRRGIGS